MSYPISHIKSSGGDVDALILDEIMSYFSKEVTPNWYDGYLDSNGTIRSEGSNFFKVSDVLEIPEDAFAVFFYAWATENNDKVSSIAFYNEFLSTVDTYMVSDHSQNGYVVLPIPSNALQVAFTSNTGAGANNRKIAFLRAASRIGVNADSIELRSMPKARLREVSGNKNVTHDRFNAWHVSEPESGNTWPYFKVQPDQIGTNTGYFCARIKSMTCDKIGVTLIYTKKSDGSLYYKSLDYITGKGTYKYAFDPNYYSVYEDYDTSGGVQIAFNTLGNDPDKNFIIDAVGYYTDTSTVGDLPRSMNSVLNEFNSRIGTLEYGAGETMGTFLTSPSGDRYVLSVSDSGALSAVPVLPDNILYIGNSLLGGFKTHGMASYDTTDDYYALVNDYVTGAKFAPTADKLIASTFEGLTDDLSVQSYLDNTLQQYLTTERDLIIVQLGDNVNTSNKVSEFKKSCGMMCSYIRSKCPNARVAWVAMWYSSSERMQVVRDACSKYGITMIDISDVPSDTTRNKIGGKYIDESGSIQTISDSGVASHPAPAGFKVIAERIIQALFDPNFQYGEE